MSISSSALESALVASIRPRLHPALLPLFDQHNACLPALEKTCQKILTLAGGMTGADRLAQLVSRDPSLTCKVLQVSNSIAYSPQQVITSVPHAVAWLGLDTVRSIVSAAQLVEDLDEWPDRKRIVSAVIAQALVAAVHANDLGMAIEYPSPSQLFSCALLYSIGDLAVANQAPELYRSLRNITAGGRTQAARVMAETELLGVPKHRLAQALVQLWALRVGGKVYGVGDRIQIAGYRGVVLDHDVFATKLLEIGPGQSAHLYTGRVAVFPNSLLFTNALIKENPTQEFGLYTLVVPIATDEYWPKAEQVLLDAARVECAPFMQEAAFQMKLLEQTNLLEAPSPEPRITIQLPEAGKMQFVLRFPAPDRGRSRVEQAILRRYLLESTKLTIDR